MSTYFVDIATTKDNDQLQAICKIPQEGNMMLAFEKSPDFFAASKIQGEEVNTYVIRERDTNTIDGLFSVARRKVFSDGNPTPILYISNLKIKHQRRGSRILYIVGRYIADHLMDEIDLAHTIVFADNEAMLQLINSLRNRNRKVSDITFFPAGDYSSYMVRFSGCSKGNHYGYTIIRADEKHIPLMNELVFSEGSKKQFYPVYDFTLLGNNYYKGLTIDNFYLAFENEKLVGMAAIWDQRAFKQTRVTGYSKTYALMRPLINLYGFITGGERLPASGDIINYLNIHSVVVKNNDSKVFDSLLYQINNDYNKSECKYFLTGFDQRDPLNTSLDKFKVKRTIMGKHFLVRNKEAADSLPHLFYLECARI